ncbi:MAG: glycosyltransferase family 4 protein [Planctomycetota bacterium]
MKTLRIVIVMIEAPVPFGNAAARGFYVLLKELAARGHHVTAFAACSKQSEIEEARHLFPSPQYDLRLYPFPKRGGLRAKIETLWKPYSFMFGDDLKSDLRRTLASGFDILHLEQLWSVWVGLDHLDRALVSVLNSYWADQEFDKSRSVKQWLHRQLLFWAERRCLKSPRYIRSCSSRLVPEIRKVNQSAKIFVVPLGLDSTQYPFVPNAQRSSTPIVGLTGSMGWYPSSSAALRLLTRLWPRIRAQIPEARLQIVGWDARSVLRVHLNDPGVTIEENVADTRPYFEKMSVMLYAPSRGSGMKIKVQEAFGYGVPVVTTSEGVEGLSAVDGVHAGVADDDEGLIERTVRLLRDFEAQNRQRIAARQLLEAECGPKPTVDAILAAYDVILQQETGSAAHAAD